MAITRSMTRNQSHDDASSMERINRCDKGGVVPWLDLNHDVLSLVMMRLGAFDFVAFSGVCKSWRSFALCNRKMFMEFKPPMAMWLSTEKEWYWLLNDFEGRRFKTFFPQSDGRKCIGLTCGYMILWGEETRDFLLVDPITRHQLHFPCVPVDAHVSSFSGIRAILVFSASLSGWLFVLLDKNICFPREDTVYKIWFSIAGKGEWNYVSYNFPIRDIVAFKGKVYTLSGDYDRSDLDHLCELKLNPEPKLTLLETKNFPKTESEFGSDDENLHLLEYISKDSYKVHQLDFGQMKWVCVSPDKIKQEYEFFISYRSQNNAAVKRESWWPVTNKNQQGRFNMAPMWYFPHECLDGNVID